MQASFTSVFDAGQVAIVAIMRSAMARKAADQPYRDELLRVLDLRFALEAAACLPAGADQDTITAYLINTYGLGRVATDPFLRPKLPVVPAMGGRLTFFALGTGVPGRVLGTGIPARVIGTRVIITPASL